MGSRILTRADVRGVPAENPEQLAYCAGKRPSIDGRSSGSEPYLIFISIIGTVYCNMNDPEHSSTPARKLSIAPSSAPSKPTDSSARPMERVSKEWMLSWS